MSLWYLVVKAHPLIPSTQKYQHEENPVPMLGLVPGLLHAGTFWVDHKLENITTFPSFPDLVTYNRFIYLLFL